MPLVGTCHFLSVSAVETEAATTTEEIWRYVLIQIWSFCAGRKTSCSGIFAYVCTEKLSFVDYLRTAQKIHLYRIGVCA